MRRLLALVLVVATVSLGSGCRTYDLAFREDDRVRITDPGNRDDVTLPLTIRWTARDFSVAGQGEAGGSFLVVIDRAPPPPRKGLDHFVSGDDSCREAARDFCLQPEYLAQKGVYRTTATELTVTSINRRTGVARAEEHRHEATVALLDAAGKRIGEAAWSVTFKVGEDE